MGALADDYAALVCDLDGVVYRGAAAVPHAVETLSAAALPVVYATNNASRSPGSVTAHLRELGLALDDDAVVTSAQAIAWVMSDELEPGAPVLVVGASALGEAVAAEGLTPVTATARREAVSAGTEDQVVPVAVVDGFGPEVSALDLAEAAYAINGGARWFASNADLTLPTDRGIAPGGGALLRAIRCAVDVDPTIAGKPQAPLYRLAAARAEVSIERCLAVGDRLDTDILGAQRAGCHSLWVLTGVDTLTSLVSAPREDWTAPTYVGFDLRALAAPARVARREGDHFRCGEVSVRLGEQEDGSSDEYVGEDRADALTCAVAALVAARDLSCACGDIGGDTHGDSDDGGGSDGTVASARDRLRAAAARLTRWLDSLPED